MRCSLWLQQCSHHTRLTQSFARHKRLAQIPRATNVPQTSHTRPCSRSSGAGSGLSAGPTPAEHCNAPRYHREREGAGERGRLRLEQPPRYGGGSADRGGAVPLQTLGEFPHKLGGHWTPGGFVHQRREYLLLFRWKSVRSCQQSCFYPGQWSQRH